jgi:hypothetical protein
LNACQIIRTSTGFLTVWTDRGKPYQAWIESPGGPFEHVL